ncbi:hypothetical protein Dtox_1980 [Desulfofarcimen acetoxidans DSM 771]|uniref:Uncharacterized protein n=2 Tax=Desulfofarcimen acetoxidans TaxID=58138 RepID=C8VYD4_DESAS|nr:hypothetical protein Dtox_1980 [Desulfofarcimen acetoxidans DSM 771]
MPVCHIVKWLWRAALNCLKPRLLRKPGFYLLVDRYNTKHLKRGGIKQKILKKCYLTTDSRQDIFAILKVLRLKLKERSCF